ncbi:hypothetical protein FB451DRAFT_1398715 [Mycena latifolia]|nr:hypothetical protein FB451DRAFT_1398715 [Mycena latifolia]
MRLPAEEPAQEPAPAVDEAACFNLVPVVPMHMIAGASPGSPSETVVEAEEHAMAVSPYPYYLQPAQDAPAEPVAGADVREEPAEVPQPRQWADEGGWDSRAVFMPVSEAVPVAATAAEDNQNLFTEPPPGERGLQRNDGDGPSGTKLSTGMVCIRYGSQEACAWPLGLLSSAAAVARIALKPSARGQLAGVGATTSSTVPTSRSLSLATAHTSYAPAMRASALRKFALRAGHVEHHMPRAQRCPRIRGASCARGLRWRAPRTRLPALRKLAGTQIWPPLVPAALHSRAPALNHRTALAACRRHSRHASCALSRRSPAPRCALKNGDPVSATLPRRHRAAVAGALAPAALRARASCSVRTGGKIRPPRAHVCAHARRVALAGWQSARARRSAMSARCGMQLWCPLAGALLSVAPRVPQLLVPDKARALSRSTGAPPREAGDSFRSRQIVPTTALVDRCASVHEQRGLLHRAPRRSTVNASSLNARPPLSELACRINGDVLEVHEETRAAGVCTRCRIAATAAPCASVAQLACVMPLPVPKLDRDRRVGMYARSGSPRGDNTCMQHTTFLIRLTATLRI